MSVFSFFRDLFGFVYESTAHVLRGNRHHREPERPPPPDMTRKPERPPPPDMTRELAAAFELLANSRRAAKPGEPWVATIGEIEVAVAVTASDRRAGTWFAEVRAHVVGRVGPELTRSNAWTGPAPDLTPSGRETRSFPALETAWDEVVKHGTHVIVSSDGRRVVAWIAEPFSARDIARVALVVATIARWDAGFATFLERLPDARPDDDDELSPAVRLAPDDIRIGLRANASTAVRLDRVGIVEADGRSPVASAHLAHADGRFRVDNRGAEITWPGAMRDRKRLLAAVEALRSLRAEAGGPYR